MSCSDASTADEAVGSSASHLRPLVAAITAAGGRGSGESHAVKLGEGISIPQHSYPGGTEHGVQGHGNARLPEASPLRDSCAA